MIIEIVNIYEGKGGLVHSMRGGGDVLVHSMRGGGVLVHSMGGEEGWQKVYFHSLLTSTLDRGATANSRPAGGILGKITPCSL